MNKYQGNSSNIEKLDQIQDGNRDRAADLMSS
jgi:hypothetical protein